MARRYRRRRNDAGIFEQLLFLVILFGTGILLQPNWQNNSTLLYIFLGLLLVLTLVVIGVIVKYRQNQRKLRALDIAAIDTMDPLEFERYVAKLLQHRGFTQVRLTEKYDYGVDILAHKDGITWGVQVKRYSGLVKAEAVRQVFTALVRYKCDRAMVITNSTYSRPARELAADNNCVLIERDELASWIVDFQAR